MARRVTSVITNYPIIKRSRLTSKGQLSMPKAIREQIGVRPGDEVEWVSDATGVHVKKTIDVEGIRKWRGYLKDLAGKDIDTLVREMRGH